MGQSNIENSSQFHQPPTLQPITKTVFAVRRNWKVKWKCGEKNGGQLRDEMETIGHQAAYRASPDTQIHRPIMYISGFLKGRWWCTLCLDNKESCTVNFIWSLLRKKLRANAFRATVQISVFSVKGKRPIWLYFPYKIVAENIRSTATPKQLRCWFYYTVLIFEMHPLQKITKLSLCSVPVPVPIMVKRSVVDPDPEPHQIKIMIRIRIKVISWIRIRITLQMTSESSNVRNMSLFEHFFKGLSLYLEARIWIQIRIRIRVKSRIQIRI
jgi:hypothetical protein